MGKSQILVIDDEWQMRNLIRLYLVRNNFEVIEASNGDEALSLLEKHLFDLIILDVMMPVMDGWETCAKIRRSITTPILMLTARTETKDKVKGLNLGADDYLVKPFEPEELIARVNALLRRSQVESQHTDNLVSEQIVFDDLIIDPEGHLIFINGNKVDFTPKEFELLLFLASSPKRVFTREVLLDQIWGDDYFGDDRTVDTHVKNIREKVRKAGLSFVPVQTIWGVGYKFKEPEELR